MNLQNDVIFTQIPYNQRLVYKCMFSYVSCYDFVGSLLFTSSYRFDKINVHWVYTYTVERLFVRIIEHTQKWLFEVDGIFTKTLR